MRYLPGVFFAVAFEAIGDLTCKIPAAYGVAITGKNYVQVEVPRQAWTRVINVLKAPALVPPNKPRRRMTNAMETTAMISAYSTT